MNIFGKMKKKGNKEYMKYEDGKIIPVEVEEHKNYKEFNINSSNREEDFDIKTVIKEKVDMPGKVKKYGTWKTLKIAGAIAIVVFFGYTVKDVYFAFIEPDTNKIVQETPNETPTDTITNPVQTETPTPTETGAYQPGSDDVGQITPVTSDEGEDKEKDTTSDNSEKSPLKTAIDASNVVNSMLASETSKELGSLNLYFDNKLNKFSFEKTLNSSLKTKTQLSAYLSEQKGIFKEEEILDFYSVTEERLNNSIRLTETILASFNNSSTQDELINEVNALIDVENTLKEKQNEEFLKLLKDKKIDYTFDEVKGEIKYTIE
ncbi:hypothetical protein CVD28_04050 [Bacillus sp. M6-12]|uniref:hypothetical protein n=1 Tax=Bacillus sp. M6-12 TaxID=2054166 RepID=UPI000C781C5B|nr:hypothetical protein [Bacillus sp. M6-12]PLS19598.1 hypothetical protein CVD28_04050 [Bacillus sp. M6-12]